jgi:acyl-CoA synthetase (AMP-forming)/AMP-acid ligase II
MTLDALLGRSAATSPDAIALIEGDRQTSYRELEALTSNCARGLLARGVSRGDRVVVGLDNGAAMVAAYFGAMRIGAVAVPVVSGPRSDRFPAVVADCSPVVAIVDPALAASPFGQRGLEGVGQVIIHQGDSPAPPCGPEMGDATALPPSADADALAAIVYTSGSTGEPRGVMLRHRNFVANAQAIVEYLSLTAADRGMCVLPFSYVYGLSLLHTHVMVGASLVIENRAAFPNVVLASMATHEVTGFAGVPSTFALMLHRSNLERTALPSLRYVTQAGGAMSPAKIDEWLARGPQAEFFVMYGATEAAARLTYLPPGLLRAKRGSIGRAIAGVELRVITEQGTEAATGEVGELVARGPSIAAGYWNRPGETAERFGPDGYRTGDLGFVDADGCFFIVGRRHDMIKVGANRVGAREIEDVLLAHAAVTEAAVVAVPDDLLGEAPVAVVSLASDLPAANDELRAFCAARLAAYKVPTRVVVVPDLPKLAVSGKVDRAAVRALVTPVSLT